MEEAEYKCRIGPLGIVGAKNLLAFNPEVAALPVTVREDVWGRDKEVVIHFQGDSDPDTGEEEEGEEEEDDMPAFLN